MIVNFRPMQAEDKELFKSFIRSLPRKDNYYLLVDVYNDQAINRWMEKIESGQTIGVIATKDSDMIGYGNLKVNDLPWTSHVGEIRMSVSAPYRSRGVGKALAEQMFSIARARGLQKVLGADGNQPGCGPTHVYEARLPYRGCPLRFCEERERPSRGPRDYVARFRRALVFLSANASSLRWNGSK